jgi:hypothetical protein
VIGTLVPEMSACDATQLLVDQGNKRIPRLLIAVSPTDEQSIDLRG